MVPKGPCWSWVHGRKFCQKVLLLLASRAAVLCICTCSSRCLTPLPNPRPAHFLCCALIEFCSVLFLNLPFFFKWGIVNLSCIGISFWSTGRPEAPSIYCGTVISQVAFPAWFQSEWGEIWSWEWEEETLGFPLSQRSCRRINFRLITVALSLLSSCR